MELGGGGWPVGGPAQEGVGLGCSGKATSKVPSGCTASMVLDLLNRSKETCFVLGQSLLWGKGTSVLLTR